MNLKRFNMIAALIAIAIIAIPFNDLPYFHDILRELSYEGPAYPMLIAIGLFVWGSFFRKRDIPRHVSFWFLCFFIIWIIISGVLNLPTILVNFTKGRSGFEKYLFQLILLAIMISSSLIIYNVMKNYWGISGVFIFRNCVLGSFLVASFVGLIDIFHLSGEKWASDLLLLTNPLIHNFPEILLYRLRSVSGEPSWFGMYMAFTFPWVFSFLLTEKRHRILFLLLVLYALVMAYFTRSRISYITIIIELIIFIVILLAKAGKHVRRGAMYVIGVGVSCSLVVMFVSVAESGKNIMDIVSTLITSQPGEEYYLSNISRFGSQQTAFNIALDHPIIGVGLGQYGFYMPDYLPDYAFASWETLLWASFLENTPWAPAHGLFARILAETGFIGLGLFVTMWAVFLRSCWLTYWKLSRAKQHNADLGIAIILSVVGILMIGFASDSFRFFGYWFLLAIGWCYIESGQTLEKRL